MSSLTLSLPHRPGNPRNSEGAFLDLADGGILFAYTRFTGSSWGDHASAVIAARISRDGGRTWSRRDRTIVQAEGRCNVMSVSLLRMNDGAIGLFTIRKNSLNDCVPYLRRSRDEGRTWSRPVRCIPAPGYWVVNNDRVIRLQSGRLILPAALHRSKKQSREIDYTSFESRGLAFFFLSDDDGRTWREARDWWALPRRSGSGLQEPGAVELPDGSLYAWCRTDIGRQWEMRSRDGGETWSRPRPSPFHSPNAPLSIKRIPRLNTHLAIWNDHHPDRWTAETHAESKYQPNTSWGRTPLAAALGEPGTHQWTTPILIEDDPDRGFCYTAIHPTRDAVLLAYCCGGRGSAVLQDLCIRRIGLGELSQRSGYSAENKT
ncbi:MAG: sialidase family protein [Opitutaceae bacterium]